jgi:hypothetical protein
MQYLSFDMDMGFEAGVIFILLSRGRLSINMNVNEFTYVLLLIRVIYASFISI